MSNGRSRQVRRQFTLGRVAGIPVHVSPTWLIVAAVITVGFAPNAERNLPDLGAGVYAVTFAFAVFLYGSVLLHEISHALTSRAFGLPVRGITLHFLGGHTEIERESPTPGRDIVISAAGPIVSLAVGGVAYVAYQLVEQPVAEYILWGLFFANLIVGIFNLLPALPLDGGHILRALVWKVSGSEHLGTVVAARAGQVLAAAVLVTPFILADGRPSMFTIVWAALIAMLLWSGASQALLAGRLRRQVPKLDVRSLARRAAPVAADTPLAEAIRQAREAGVRSLVVVDSANQPTGLVSEAAVVATPEDRRPWIPVHQVARSIRPGMILPADLPGEQLVAAVRATPASEYLVVDNAGAVYGVLVTSDIDNALSAS
ncbi:MAG TPA: site-2 protease family protein [Jiangellaceae bacterium]